MLDEEEIDLMEEAQLRQVLKMMVKDMIEMKEKYKEKTDADDKEEDTERWGSEATLFRGMAARLKFLEPRQS